MSTSRKFQIGAGVGLLLLIGLSLWPGDVINRYRARDWHGKAVSAAFASDWKVALESFRLAAAARPTDEVLQRDYVAAQEKWLRSLEEKTAPLSPEERWKFFETAPQPAVREQLSEPLASQHRAFIAQNLEIVRENMRQKFAHADELLDSNWNQAEAVIDEMKPKAAAFEGFALAVASFERSLAVRRLQSAARLAEVGDWMTGASMLADLKNNPQVSAEERADVAYRIETVKFGNRTKYATDTAAAGDVLKGMAILNEAEAAIPKLTALDGFNRAFNDVPAADRPTRLSVMVEAARLTIRQQAAPNYARKLVAAIVAHQAAQAQATLDEYGQVLARKFRTTGEQLATEADFGRFCGALEELGILQRDETDRVRTMEPIVVVEMLRPRFTDKRGVRDFLAKSYHDLGGVLIEQGRFALAMYVLELAHRESGQPDLDLATKAQEGCAKRYAFSLYLPPTAKGSKVPVSLVNACRAAVKETLSRSAGNWITVRDDMPANSAAAFFQLRTELKDIEGTKTSSAQAYAGQYQSGSQNIANPDYESLKYQLEQAQNEYNNQAQANANAQAIYNAAGVSGSDNVAIALNNAVATAALQDASNRVNQLNSQLANTPSVVPQPVYATATYQVFTHLLKHRTTFSASLTAFNAVVGTPFSATAEFAYTTQESRGDSRLGAPAIRPEYLTGQALANYLAKDLVGGISQQSPAILKLIADMTLEKAWAIAHKPGDPPPSPEESVSEVVWGIVALWEAGGYRVPSYADQEGALRLTLGLPLGSATTDVGGGQPASATTSQ